MDRHVRLSSQLRQLDRALQVLPATGFAEGSARHAAIAALSRSAWVCAGGDDEAVDAGGEQLLDAAHRRGADLIGHLGELTRAPRRTRTRSSTRAAR